MPTIHKSDENCELEISVNPGKSDFRFRNLNMANSGGCRGPTKDEGVLGEALAVRQHPRNAARLERTRDQRQRAARDPVYLAELQEQADSRTRRRHRPIHPRPRPTSRACHRRRFHREIHRAQPRAQFRPQQHSLFAKRCHEARIRTQFVILYTF